MKFVIIKKVISIFLIFLLGFNSFGLFFFYWGNIQLCKIKAEEYADEAYTLPEKTLNVFSAGSENFQLVNKSEIIAGGRLYDIVRTEIIGGKIIYYALADNDEDEYSRGLIDWGKGNSQEKSFPSKTINVHIGKYFNLETCTSIKCFFSGDHQDKFARCIFFYKSPFRNIISPPPDYLLS